MIGRTEVKTALIDGFETCFCSVEIPDVGWLGSLGYNLSDEKSRR